MYCNKCGRAVRHDDIFCSHCGNKLQHLDLNGFGNEEIVYNQIGVKEPAAEEPMFGFNSTTPAAPEPQEAEPTRPRIDTSEFVWDVRDFQPAPKRTEDYVVDWQKLQIYETTTHRPVDDEPAQPASTTAQAANTPAQAVQTPPAQPANTQAMEPSQAAAFAVAEHAAREVLQARATGSIPKITPETETPASFKTPAGFDMSGLETELRIEPKIEPEQTKDVPVSIEDIQSDIDKDNEDASRDAAKIEKFYTFNQKNEEFQKLLDQEYERVNQSRSEENKAKSDKFEPDLGQFPQPESWSAEESGFVPAFKNPAFQGIGEAEEEAEEAETTASPFEAFDPQAHLREAEAERMAATADVGMKGAISADGIPVGDAPDVLDNDSLIKKFDTRELEKDVLEIEIEKEKKRREREARYQEAKERERILDELYGKIQEAQPEPQEEAPAFAEATPEPEASAEPQPEKPAEPQTPAYVEATPEPEAAVCPEPTADVQTQIFESAPAYVEPESEPVASPEPAVQPDDPNQVIAGEPEPKDYQPVYEPALEVTRSFDLSALEELERSAKQTFGEDEEEEKTAGQKFLTFIIALAAICLVLEIALAGIVNLAPESGAAQMIKENLGAFVVDFGGDDEEPAPEVDAEPVAPPEGTPFSTEDLVMHASNFNYNITVLKADSSWGFDPTAKYEEERIQNSKPIENNVWYRDDNDNPVFSDRCAVDTIVMYDSQWVAYANQGAENVFSLLKEGSDVYKSCKSLKDAGKLNKNFSSLYIGEVRQTEGGFLVWAKETIKTTVDGKSDSATYNCVYFIEDTNYTMRVAECYQL